MTWQRVRIRILAHPRLEVGKEYEAERDDEENYYVPPQYGHGYDTVFKWEAEEENESEPFCPACDAGVGQCNGPHKGTAGEIPY